MSRLDFDEGRAAALFLLAGIKVKGFEELPNAYWPNVDHYAELRRSSPWFLAFTDFGPVKIGWRKRVLSISWERTAIRAVVTEDDTTKDETLVHAWTYGKAVEYLTALGEQPTSHGAGVSE